MSTIYSTLRIKIITKKDLKYFRRSSILYIESKNKYVKSTENNSVYKTQSYLRSSCKKNKIWMYMNVMICHKWKGKNENILSRKKLGFFKSFCHNLN